MWSGDFGGAALERPQHLEPYLHAKVADVSLGGPVLSKRCLKSRINIHEAHPAESSGNLSLGGESQSSQTPRKFCLWG